MPASEEVGGRTGGIRLSRRHQSIALVAQFQSCAKVARRISRHRRSLISSSQERERENFICFIVPTLRQRDHHLARALAGPPRAAASSGIRRACSSEHLGLSKSVALLLTLSRR